MSFFSLSALCIEDLTGGIEGSIKSPGYDLVTTYPNDRFCRWTIKGVSSYFVTITINEFRLEAPDSNGDCTKDNVVIDTGGFVLG